MESDTLDFSSRMCAFYLEHPDENVLHERYSNTERSGLARKILLS